MEVLVKLLFMISMLIIFGAGFVVGSTMMIDPEWKSWASRLERFYLKYKIVKTNDNDKPEGK